MLALNIILYQLFSYRPHISIGPPGISCADYGILGLFHATKITRNDAICFVICVIMVRATYYCFAVIIGSRDSSDLKCIPADYAVNMTGTQRCFYFPLVQMYFFFEKDHSGEIGLVFRQRYCYFA